MSPSPRLYPETAAVSILTKDLADFWTCFCTQTSPQPSPPTGPTSPPTSTTSQPQAKAQAAIYLSLQSALQFNNYKTAKLRVEIAQYPALFTDLQAFTPRPAKPDTVLDGIVADYLNELERKPGVVRASTPWPGAAELVLAALQNGRMRRLFGEDEEGRLTLEYALRQAEEVPPAIWLVQGDEDGMVAKEAADELAERVRRERPRAVVKYTVRPGGHGFDGLSRLRDEWVRERLEFVSSHWL